MGPEYHYTFSAPATVRAAELMAFLKGVEASARDLGLGPTVVFAAEFDWPEWRKIGKSLVPVLHVQDDRLKGGVPVDKRQVWDLSSGLGHCRVVPDRAVVLGVTSDRGAEMAFGFAWYPAALRDVHGRELMAVPEGGKWFWRHSVQTADPRLRQVVKQFGAAGYLVEERDEFKPA
jgi:hypothetical protein